MQTFLLNPSGLKIFRRSLRKKSTKAERKLWAYIRNRKLGAKFNRQFGIGNFIVDFCSRQYKLIVELDGCVHNLKEVAEYDFKRSQILRSFGYKILRFKNQEVLGNIDFVLENIKKNLILF
ncbi:MAG: Leucine-tRNA ligase [Candidatus Uhrbacteria bacterium GW2011_GWE2_45_35]|uniref:Leucine-tRNA ligase n=2 Tax=Candidatus Uhriibacteriota TaxID=1752732 RepID=A0A0G1JEH7_9BACT|nr:MAG: Leucine-tRNA ligase [Candidatus Uhrbacteria bacterium GW2011_GWF2_44_350]KKU08854.1 MAG: Leucine-tRNA ligase [Candidatus Uhrbacteria bacterium GW2011_GWE2_45_35]HBR80660.1 cytosine methyltransferase [Candidatus Uhrbacteria bacterium]HCU31858.1 cytosine methyltransferase [Candidatus Uhrbacteria bacterium]